MLRGRCKLWGFLGLWFVCIAASKPGPQTEWKGDLIVQDERSLGRFRGLLVLRGDLVVHGTAVRRIDLPNLRVVTGDVRIENNEQLENLQGLRNLVGVNGDFRLKKNPSLSSLEGLESLTWVGGDFELVGNRSLQSLRGAEGLSKVGRNLTLRANAALTSVEALAQLQVVGGLLEIEKTRALKSLEGLLPARLGGGTWGGDVAIASNDGHGEHAIEDWLVRLRSKGWTGVRRPWPSDSLSISRHDGGRPPKKASDVRIWSWRKIEGELERLQLEEADRDREIQLAECFIEHSSWISDVRGRIAIAYTIQLNGEVHEPRVVRDSYWAERGIGIVSRCMVKKVQTWRYPPSPLGQPTSVTASWRFFH